MTDDETEAIRRAAMARAGATRALLADLVAACGTGPAAVEARFGDAMREVGCTVEAFDYSPATVPLVDEFANAAVSAAGTERCLVGRSGGAGPSLILFAHPDVEPYRAEPAWRSAPYSLHERDGRLHGWGIADDLAGLATMSEALAVLRDAGYAPAGAVSLVSAPSKAHRRGIAAALHRGLTADAAVYCHPAESGRGLDEIKAFTPGQLEFLVVVTGRPPDTMEPAHTPFVHTAVNPFDKAVVIAEALRGLDAVRGSQVTHPRLEGAIGRSVNVMVSHIACGAPDRLSRLAPSATLGCAMTLIPGERLPVAMQEVEAAIATAAEADPWLADHPPAVAWQAGASGAETAEDHPLYRLAAETLARFGAAPRVNALHTSSDIRNPIVQKGIPTVGFGPLAGGLTMAGGADEWVDAEDMQRAIAATAALVAGWCGTVPA